MNRVVGTARLHLVGRQNIVVPWAVLASALAVNLVVFAALQAGDAVQETPFTGGLASLYVVMAAGFVQLMNKNLNFAVGLGLTRGTYLRGTALFAVLLAFGSALALDVLLGVERATDGWGLQLGFFGLAGLVPDNPLVAVPAYAVPMLTCMALGAFYGSINHRWGMIGVYASGLLAFLAGGLFTVVMTYADAWGSLLGWFGRQPNTALLAGYPLIAVAVLSVAAFLVTRRAEV